LTRELGAESPNSEILSSCCEPKASLVLPGKGRNAILGTKGTLTKILVLLEWSILFLNKRSDLLSNVDSCFFSALRK
jgi:hypothetical protein